MITKYKVASGKVLTEDELKNLFSAIYHRYSDIEFDIWLYLGIESKAIEEWNRRANDGT